MKTLVCVALAAVTLVVTACEPYTPWWVRLASDLAPPRYCNGGCGTLKGPLQDAEVTARMDGQTDLFS